MTDKLTAEEIFILRADLLNDGKWLPGGRERVKILCDMALASLQYVPPVEKTGAGCQHRSACPLCDDSSPAGRGDGGAIA